MAVVEGLVSVLEFGFTFIIARSLISVFSALLSPMALGVFFPLFRQRARSPSPTVL